jgi:hypothetical protein
LLKAGADESSLEHVNCRAWQYSGLSTSSIQEQAELQVGQVGRFGKGEEEVDEGRDEAEGLDSLRSLRQCVDDNCSVSTINNTTNSSNAQSGTFCVNYSGSENGSGLMHVRGLAPVDGTHVQPKYISKKRMQLLDSPEKSLRPPLPPVGTTGLGRVALASDGVSGAPESKTTSMAMGIHSAATSGVGGMGTVGVGGVDKGVTSVEAELDAWRVSIDSTDTDEDRSGSTSGHGGSGAFFTVYLVTVSTAVDTWTVKKRFREFHKLHRLLSQDLRKSAKNPHGGITRLGFPKRGLGLGGFGMGMGSQGVDSPELKLERLVHLGSYLQRVLSRRRELTDRKLLALFSFLCYGGVVARARMHAHTSLQVQQELVQKQQEQLQQQQKQIDSHRRRREEQEEGEGEGEGNAEEVELGAEPVSPQVGAGGGEWGVAEQADLHYLQPDEEQVGARGSCEVSTSMDAIALDLDQDEEVGVGTGNAAKAETMSVSCQTEENESGEGDQEGDGLGEGRGLGGGDANRSRAWEVKETREMMTSPIAIPQETACGGEACEGSGTSRATGGSTLAQHLLEEAAGAMADVMVEAMIDVLSEVAADVMGRPTPEFMGFLGPSIDHFGTKSGTAGATRSRSEDFQPKNGLAAVLSPAVGPSPAGSSMGPSPEAGGWAMGAEEIFRRRYWRAD